MGLRDWTPLVFLSPESHFAQQIQYLDLERWSEEVYEWEEDGWNGWKDFASDPVHTVWTNRGDCEDYALVAGSWAYAHGYSMTFALCFQGYSPIPQHMVVSFKGNVYSSDGIRFDTTLEEYIEESKYDHHITRNIK